MGHSRLPPPPPLLPLDALCPPLPPAPVRRPVPVASASPHGVSPDAAPRAVHRPPVPPSVPPLEVMCPPVPAPPRRRPVPTVDVAPTRIPVVVVGGGSGRGRAEGYDISSNENEPDAEEDSEADEVRALHLRWLEMLELQRALNLSSAEVSARVRLFPCPRRASGIKVRLFVLRVLYACTAACAGLCISSRPREPSAARPLAARRRHPFRLPSPPTGLRPRRLPIFPHRQPAFLRQQALCLPRCHRRRGCRPA